MECHHMLQFRFVRLVFCYESQIRSLFGMVENPGDLTRVRKLVYEIELGMEGTLDKCYKLSIELTDKGMYSSSPQRIRAVRR